jgi:hypothetical protein
VGANIFKNYVCVNDRKQVEKTDLLQPIIKVKSIPARRRHLPCIFTLRTGRTKRKKMVLQVEFKLGLKKTISASCQ